MTSARPIVTALLCLAAIGTACRSHVDAAPVPLPADWRYCWWTVYRSPLPLDSVATGFRRAFVTAGLAGIRWDRSGDTIWVRAGPAPLAPSQLPFDTASHGA